MVWVKLKKNSFYTILRHNYLLKIIFPKKKEKNG